MSCLSPMLRVPCGYDRWSLQNDGVLKEKALILKDMPSQRKKLEECNIPYDVIPCGHCPECFTKRVKDWSIRLLQESYQHKENYFVTFTFDDRHLPLNRSLSKKHVQKLIKRMRNYISNVLELDCQFKYYAVGEYGEGKGERMGFNPHYHILFFGLNLSNMAGLSEVWPDGHPHTSQSGDKLLYSPMLSEMWPFGTVTVQEITYGTVSYVAGYVHKKLFDDVPVIHKEVDFYRGSDGKAFHFIVPVKYEMHKYAGVAKPFSLMSKGLGKDWLESSIDLVYLTDEIFYHSGAFGALSAKPPRYYDKLLGRHNEEKANQIKENRKKLARMKVNVVSDSQFFYNMNVKESQIVHRRSLRKRNLS